MDNPIAITKRPPWATQYLVVRALLKREAVTRFGKYMRTIEPGLLYFISLWGLLGTIHHFRITDTKMNDAGGEYRLVVRG